MLHQSVEATVQAESTLFRCYSAKPDLVQVSPTRQWGVLETMPMELNSKYKEILGNKCHVENKLQAQISQHTHTHTEESSTMIRKI